MTDEQSQLKLFVPSSCNSKSCTPTSRPSNEPETCSNEPCETTQSSATSGAATPPVQGSSTPTGAEPVAKSSVGARNTEGSAVQLMMPRSIVRRTPTDGPALQRPLKRGDCVNGPRPCPWVGCRHHLLIEVSEPRGDRATGLRLTGPNPPRMLAFNADARTVDVFMDEALQRLFTMRDTCSLDVADAHERGCSEIADAFGVSRQDMHHALQLALAQVRDASKNETTFPRAQGRPLENTARYGGAKNGVKTKR